MLDARSGKSEELSADDLDMGDMKMDDSDLDMSDMRMDN
jgi:hypothetical protein